MKSLYFAELDAFIRYHNIPGKGKILVFLPGLSMPSLEQFLGVVTHPDIAGYQSLLIDYIGSGYSDHSPRFEYSIENHARSVAAVLDNEGINCCTVIGHSMGGTVGIMLSRIRPDLVAKLVVAEANLSPGGGEATRRIASYTESDYVNEGHQTILAELRKAELQGDQKAAFIYAAWSRAFPSGLYKSSVALVDLDETFKELFKELSIPRTFIYGEKSIPKDRCTSRPDAPDPYELAEFDIQITTIPNAGHAMMFDNLEGFVEVLTKVV